MFRSVFPRLGYQPFNDWFAPSTVQAMALGEKLTGVDPYWGEGTFLYVQTNTTIAKGQVCIWDETFNATLCPATAHLGFPVGFAMAPLASGQFGWLQIAGRCVYATNATVAADTAVSIAASGTVGTLAAGTQICGLRNRVAATGTVTVSVTTQSGSSKVLAQKGYDGFFLGMALSGTGIPASTVVAALDPDGKTIYLGSAVGTIGNAATATGSATLTGTYTGFGSGVCEFPEIQSQIT